MFAQVNAVLWFGVLIVAVFVFSALVVRDPVYCVVWHAGEEVANGFYGALNGVYLKRGTSPSTFLPDFFDMVSMHRDLSSSMGMSLTKHMWIMSRGSEVLYINTPSAQDASKYIDSPPLEGWGWGNDVEKIPVTGVAPIISHCSGSLQDSPTSSTPTAASASGNLRDVMQNPSTALLLLAITLYDLYLWAYRVESDKVAYSYDAVVNRGQYWRMLTASFAHFEPLHWLFNTVSLYQLGFLESAYGSTGYAYLSLDLIFVTQALCVAMDHVLIYRYNRPEIAQRLAVGYSCVLFAWMVAASVRMNKFCPIFLLPSLCFDTYRLPIFGLPVNAGPLILLIVTKIIIPQSSFLGHLSGIVIGYPLAWNWLDWLTPPLFCSLTAALCLYARGMFVWRYPGYELQAAAPLADFVGSSGLAWLWRLQCAVYLSAMLALSSAFVFGPLAAFPRFVLVFGAWSALQSRRCAHVTEMHNVVEDTGSHLVLLLCLSAVLALCDTATCGVYSTSWAFVSAYSTSGDTGFGLGIALSACCLLLELLICVIALNMSHDIPATSAMLSSMGLGPTAFGFAINAYNRLVAFSTGPFAGRAHRLDGGMGGGDAEGAMVEISSPVHAPPHTPKTVQL